MNLAQHSQNLSRHLRLAKSSDFQAVFEHRKKFRLPGLTVYIRPNCLPYSRLGLAISKRAIKTARARNTIKRAIRDSFRRQMKQNLVGLDMVFVSRTELVKMDKKELQAVLTNICQYLPRSFKKSY